MALATERASSGEQVMVLDDEDFFIPPWRVAKQTGDGVELTWALDLGHESGWRVWFVARADRLADGWKVRKVELARAHVMGRTD